MSAFSTALFATFGVVVTLVVTLVALSAGTAAAASCSSPGPPPPGPVHWWPADGDFVDAAGGGVPARAVPGGGAGVIFGPDRFGVAGRAFHFRGPANPGAVAFVNDTFHLHAPVRNGSVVFWVRADSPAHASILWTRPDGNDIDRFHLWVGNASHPAIGVDYVPPGGGPHHLDGDWPLGAAVLPPGGWAHVALTRAGVVYRLYIDGVLVRAVSDVAPDPPTAYGWTLSGRAASFSFDGLIDDLMIFDRTLSDDEVSCVVSSSTTTTTTTTTSASQTATQSETKSETKSQTRTQAVAVLSRASSRPLSSEVFSLPSRTLPVPRSTARSPSGGPPAGTINASLSPPPSARSATGDAAAASAASTPTPSPSTPSVSASASWSIMLLIVILASVVLCVCALLLSTALGTVGARRFSRRRDAASQQRVGFASARLPSAFGARPAPAPPPSSVFAACSAGTPHTGGWIGAATAVSEGSVAMGSLTSSRSSAPTDPDDVVVYASLSDASFGGPDTSVWGQENAPDALARDGDDGGGEVVYASLIGMAGEDDADGGTTASDASIAASAGAAGVQQGSASSAGRVVPRVPDAVEDYEPLSGFLAMRGESDPRSETDYESLYQSTRGS